MSANRKNVKGRSKAAIFIDQPLKDPQNQTDTSPEIIMLTVTLPSATSATAVPVIPDNWVGSNRKFYLTNWFANVNGATAWTAGGGGFTKLSLQGTDGTDFLDLGVNGLTGNANLFPGTANTTPQVNYTQGLGGVAGKGLQVIADNTPGAGSPVILTVMGYLK